MIFKELWDLLEHGLFLRESTTELFNQNRDRNLSVDLADANEIRKENLQKAEQALSIRKGVGGGVWT
jgi:hypothetical protein